MILQVRHILCGSCHILCGSCLSFSSHSWNKSQLLKGFSQHFMKICTAISAFILWDKNNDHL